MTMERKIGEIFEYNGEWYQCVVAMQGCRECSFRTQDYCTRHSECLLDIRSDKTSVIFKKLEKVGEPYKFGRKLMQKYNIYAKPYLSDDYGYIYIPGRYNEVISIEIKENMEEQHSTENYPKEDEVATRIANKVGEDIRDQLEKNLNKEDMEENNNAKHSNSEKIGKNLKPFDLQKAREGKPVCTRDGRKARIICFDRKHCHQGHDYPIVALISDCYDEFLCSYTKDGLFAPGGCYNTDLMMLPEKKEGWINVYKNQIHNTFKSAEEGHKGTTDYIKTIKVSWEE